MVSDWGTVDGAAASDTRGPRFEANYFTRLLSTVDYIEETNRFKMISGVEVSVLHNYAMLK